jgi:predicted nucleic acid-binding protein
MATTAVDLVVVDTNVLVYTNVASAPLHAHAGATLLNLEAAGVALWISRQVLREYLAMLSRPQTFTNPLSPAVLAADVTRFQAQFHVAEDGPGVAASLLTLQTTIPIGASMCTTPTSSPRCRPTAWAGS